MKWTIQYIEQGEYLKVVNEGVFLPGDTLNLYQSIFSNEYWKPDTPILMDNRRIDYRNVNYQVVSEASRNLASRAQEIGKSKICYLVNSQVGFGLSRQFQILMADKSSIAIEIFMDEKAAADWITKKEALEV